MSLQMIHIQAAFTAAHATKPFTHGSPLKPYHTPANISVRQMMMPMNDTTNRIELIFFILTFLT